MSTKALRTVRDSHRKETIDNLVGVAGLIAIALWLGYSFFYAPAHRSETGAPQTARSSRGKPVSTLSPELSVRMALLQVFPDSNGRLEFLQGANLDVFMTRAEFQSLPFPDRGRGVQDIGKAWCNVVDYTFLPLVQIRDLRNGQVLASYSCVTGRIKLPELQ